MLLLIVEKTRGIEYRLCRVCPFGEKPHCKQWYRELYHVRCISGLCVRAYRACHMNDGLVYKGSSAIKNNNIPDCTCTAVLFGVCFPPINQVLIFFFFNFYGACGKRVMFVFCFCIIFQELFFYFPTRSTVKIYYRVATVHGRG